LPKDWRGKKGSGREKWRKLPPQSGWETKRKERRTSMPEAKSRVDGEVFALEKRGTEEHVIEFSQLPGPLPSKTGGKEKGRGD